MNITDPIISVCRDTNKIAVFDGFRIVCEFIAFTDEQWAIDQAKRWLVGKTTAEVKIVYPKITRFSAR